MVDPSSSPTTHTVPRARQEWSLSTVRCASVLPHQKKSIHKAKETGSSIGKPEIKRVYRNLHSSRSEGNGNCRVKATPGAFSFYFAFRSVSFKILKNKTMGLGGGQSKGQSSSHHEHRIIANIIPRQSIPWKPRCATSSPCPTKNNLKQSIDSP